MKDDPRCCGTGTCIINDEGQCWCGQTWDGEKMCFNVSEAPTNSENSLEAQSSQRLDETPSHPATALNRPYHRSYFPSQ